MRKVNVVEAALWFAYRHRTDDVDTEMFDLTRGESVRKFIVKTVTWDIKPVFGDVKLVATVLSESGYVIARVSFSPGEIIAGDDDTPFISTEVFDTTEDFIAGIYEVALR